MIFIKKDQIYLVRDSVPLFKFKLSKYIMRDYTFEKKVERMIEITKTLNGWVRKPFMRKWRKERLENELDRIADNIESVMWEKALNIVLQYVHENTKPIEMWWHEIYNSFQLYHVLKVEWIIWNEKE